LDIDVRESGEKPNERGGKQYCLFPALVFKGECYEKRRCFFAKEFLVRVENCFAKEHLGKRCN